MLDEHRELLFADGDRGPAARPEIVASWRRSRGSGVDPDRLTVKLAPEAAAQQLTRNVAPALATMAELMIGSRTGLLLTDRYGRVVWRWADEDGLHRTLERYSVVVGVHLDEASVGTNGVGTALETIRPVAVTGTEHYVEALHRFSCVAVPLRHPTTNRVEGALSLTCLVEDANPLMRPTLLKLAREVEAHLFGEASARDRELVGHFLAARRRSRHAVVAMNDEILIANRAGVRLGLDPQSWWARAEQDLLDYDDVALPPDTKIGTADRNAETPKATARIRSLREGHTLVGLVVVVPEASEPSSPISARPPRTPRDAAFATARSVLVKSERLLVHGESGTGKATLLRELGFPVIDAGATPASPSKWLGQARTMLSEPAGLGLIHLDALDDRGCRALASLLDAGGPHPTVAATWAGPLVGVSSAQQALLDRFSAEVVEFAPLRSKPDDILPLLDRLVTSMTVEAGRAPPRLTQSATELVSRHPWPGNFRQVDQFARWLSSQERALVDVEHLPQQLRRATPRTTLTAMETAEADAIRAALLDCGGNKVATASALGISRSSLYRKMRIYGLRA